MHGLRKTIEEIGKVSLIKGVEKVKGSVCHVKRVIKESEEILESLQEDY